jgi:SAM-dependent methyltransferase
MLTEEQIKKGMEKRINKLIKAGKSKEVKEFKKFHLEEDLRDAFFNKLFLIGYEKDKKKKQKLLKQAKNIAKKIPDLKDWPKDPKTFWNIESYGWESRIPKEIREEIKKELSQLKGKNLSLGSGSHPYVANSTLIDISEEMLKNLKGKKVILDLNKAKLPFKNNTFDSVTMVFIVDYLKNLKQLIKEVKRVLNKDGKLIIINSKKPINEFYRIQEHQHVTDFNKILKDFKVEIKEKLICNQNIIFIQARI